MYRIEDTTVVNVIESDSRTFRALLDFDDGTAYSGADVGKITADHAQSDDDTLQIGGVLARHAEIRLYSDRLPKKGAVFRLYLYLLDRDGSPADPADYADLRQWTHRELSSLTHRQISGRGQSKDPDGVPLDGCMIPMGEFLVSRVRRQGCEAVLDCYDKLSQDAVYMPTVTFPANSWDVVDDVIAQLGIPGRRQVVGGYLKTASGEYVLTASGERIRTGTEYSFTVPSVPAGTGCREVLGWIAAMYGGNGVTDREGYYTTQFYSRTVWRTIPSHTDEPEFDDQATAEDGSRYLYIKGLICTVDDTHTLSTQYAQEDDPHTIAFACPWMTQARLDDIKSRFDGIFWYPGSVTERLGDPRRDLGDLISPGSSNDRMLLSSLRYQFDGGLTAEIESCGNEVVNYG